MASCILSTANPCDLPLLLDNSMGGTEGHEKQRTIQPQDRTCTVQHRDANSFSIYVLRGNALFL